MAEDPQVPSGTLTDEDSNLYGVFGPSPSQTVGPYFHQGLIDGFQGQVGVAGNDLVRPELTGERIVLTGRVYDGDGVPVPDALLEFWPAGAYGRLMAGPGAGFTGFGRTHTRTDDARYTLRTIKPGRIRGQPPRLIVWLGLRGLLTHLITFVYFGDEDNSGDPTLNAVPEERRGTVIAACTNRAGEAVYTFDIHLRGGRETAFFDAY